MFSVTQSPTDPRGLVFRGTPAELADQFDELMTEQWNGFIEILGLTVEHVHRGAQHNAQPAFGFSLADQMGNRNVGRLTLIDDTRWYDASPEWTVYYDTVEEAKENLRILSEKSVLPKFSRVCFDLAYEEDTLEEALANISAAWGISCKVETLKGPGGGWPVIEYSGFTDRVLKMLTGANDEYGYEMDNDEALELLRDQVVVGS